MGDPHIVTVEPNDNVATAIRDVSEDETVNVNRGDDEVTVDVLEDVRFGHKLALEDIPEGETVYKYGLSIGTASQDIEVGDRVHVHNVESNYGRGDKTAKAREQIES